MSFAAEVRRRSRTPLVLSWLLTGSAILLGLHVVAIVAGEIGEAPPSAEPALIARDIVAAAAALLVAGAMRPQTPLPAIGRPDRMAIAASGGLLIASTTLFVVSPRAYSWLAQEDGVAEYATAVLLILTALQLVASVRPALQAGNRRFAGILGLGAVMGLVLALEEISYGQRLFGLETGGVFLTANEQEELNLHNLATDELELLFYVGVLAVLTFWPLLTDPGGRMTTRAIPALLADLRPSTATAVVAATGAGLIYDQWNVILIQGAFAATVVALVVAGRRCAETRDRVLLWSLAAIILTTQLTSLALGTRYVRAWDVTEVRELVIGVALVWWARELRHRAASSDGAGVHVPA